MRLDKFLSDSSPYSRSVIRLYVRQKRIAVNGQCATNPAQSVETNDRVEIDGKIFPYRKYVYLMLNKPQGYLSATEDARDPVVTELVPPEFRKFAPFPVGRLDKDTEGLLLLTNDGDFDHALTSPRKEVFKRYFARLDKDFEPADGNAFGAGMVFADFTAKPGRIFPAGSGDPREVFVEIAEGKFHQVKRMCEKIGKCVLYLKRVAIGDLELDPALPEGKMRELTPEELRAIYTPKKSSAQSLLCNARSNCSTSACEGGAVASAATTHPASPAANPGRSS